MDLDILKNHIRVDHGFEDALIVQYQKWAEAEVKDSVSTSATRNEDYFNDNPHFEKAVILLTSHYYHNRLPMGEVKQANLPFAINSAIHKLRGGYHE